MSLVKQKVSFVFVEQRSPEENLVFLYTLFLENAAQIDKNNYRTMLSMPKQVSLPKISLILLKMKIRLKKQYCVLFAWKP